MQLKKLMGWTIQSLSPARTRENVHVQLSASYNRILRQGLSEKEDEEYMDRVWQSMPSHLFNATKLRLKDASSKGDNIVLRCGLTDYKTYLGTCCSSRVDELLEAAKGAEDEYAYVSRKLGVSGLLCTSDGYLPLIRRSDHVGTYQRMYDTPGGHPEPEHISLTPELLSKLDDSESKSKDKMEEAVTNEVFQSILNEVHEEINVAPKDISPPLLLGVVYQGISSTPSLAFAMDTPKTADQIQQLYQDGPADQYESVHLQMIDSKDLLENKLPSTFWSELTPSAHGSLKLWQQHMTSQ